MTTSSIGTDQDHLEPCRLQGDAEARAEQRRRGWTKWRIALHEGQMIGRAGFGLRGQDRDLAYTLWRDQGGQGLGTEIALAFVDWHRQHTAHQRLWAVTATANVPSCRVLQAAGFERISTVDHHGVACYLYCLP
jgi:RimJ/RimL family protein N-acetyltransferase